MPAPALYEPTLTVSTMGTPRIGTAELPVRIEREQYFQRLSYLELSVLFPAPLKPAAISRWQIAAPPGAVGLVAPWVLTHRKPPAPGASWSHDTSVGDFRDSAPGRSALAALREAVTALTARHVLFRSPPLFAPSSANREQLRRFFSEVATEDTVGTSRVWIPDGLWEPRVAVGFASELGVVCAIDPLVHDPSAPAEVYEDLEATALYFRVAGLGRAGTIRTEQLEDLAALVEHYEGAEITVAFASAQRWQDARNFKKLLSIGEEESPLEGPPDDQGPDDQGPADDQ